MSCTWTNFNQHFYLLKYPNPIVTYAEALLLDLEHLMATLDQMAHNHSTLKISELLSHGKYGFYL